MIPTVVILAGGLATRLKPITKTTPKSLIQINDIPFVLYQLELLRKNKINRVHFCLGYLGEMVEEIINKSMYMKSMEITFSYDGMTPLGTGGAVKKALNYLTDNFFVMYGDSYLDINYLNVLNFFNKTSSEKDGLMTIYKNNKKFDTSNVIFEENKIIKYSKTDLSDHMNYIDYGLGILRKEYFNIYDDKKKFDLSIIYEDLSRNSILLGYESYSRFYEIGSLNGIKDFKNYINNKL